MSIEDQEETDGAGSDEMKQNAQSLAKRRRVPRCTQLVNKAQYRLYIGVDLEHLDGERRLDSRERCLFLRAWSVAGRRMWTLR